MNIRIVRMGVRQRFVTMRMRVRFHAVPSECVRVLVVIVVHMPVDVLKRFVGVLVRMPFAHVQPNAKRHQGCGRPIEWTGAFWPQKGWC